MKIALIISYWERPDLLELCLASIATQTRKPDEIIILDDGSITPPPFKGDRYIRREHDGYGKYRLANHAIVETDCDYLIFLDQDCVVPKNFVKTHSSLAWVLPGNVRAMYTSLTPEESALVDVRSIETCTIWQTITRRYEGEPQIWCCSGSGVWRNAALAINGFDTRLGLIGSDINFGLRLDKAGILSDHFCRYGRYFHLWHEKPYAVVGEEKARQLELARKLAGEGPRTPCGIAEIFNHAFIEGESHGEGQ